MARGLSKNKAIIYFEFDTNMEDFTGERFRLPTHLYDF